MADLLSTSINPPQASGSPTDQMNYGFYNSGLLRGYNPLIPGQASPQPGMSPGGMDPNSPWRYNPGAMGPMPTWNFSPGMGIVPSAGVGQVSPNFGSNPGIGSPYPYQPLGGGTGSHMMPDGSIMSGPHMSGGAPSGFSPIDQFLLGLMMNLGSSSPGGTGMQPGMSYAGGSKNFNEAQQSGTLK